MGLNLVNCGVDRGLARRIAGLASMVLVVLSGTPAVRGAGQDPAEGLGQRGERAERVLVGRVSSVSGVWRENEFGDRLIHSVLRVSVEETLKGAPQASVEVEVEGGTIGDLTLRVSDVATFSPGDRGIFYLRRNARGALVPQDRGQGLLKLDRNNRVVGSTLTLEQVRRSVRGGGAR
ncbi:MAG TPA: hypothetical protein VD833_23165 [Vicinamibacterales bacterium]|nr:hypothetical protein [Vicinamibacterales bacterium]